MNTGDLNIFRSPRNDEGVGDAHSSGDTQDNIT